MEDAPPPVLRGESGKDYTKRKVFVGGLNLETTEAELKEFLGQFGEIVELTIIKDKHSKKSRGFGFVTYRRKRVARQLLATPLTLAGCRLELNLAEPKTPSKLGELKDTTEITKIFVGGLPKTSTNQDLLDYFSKYGAIQEACIAEDKKTLQHRGFGFVIFEKSQSTQDVIRDYKLHTIQSKWVECKIALPKFVNESAKKPSDHIAAPLSDSTESEVEEVPDLLEKIEKSVSMEIVPEKVSQRTRSTAKRSLVLPQGSGNYFDTEQLAKDYTEAKKFEKSANFEDTSRRERLKFMMGGIERCESRGVSKGGRNMPRGSKYFELSGNHENHRSISIRPKNRGEEHKKPANNTFQSDQLVPRLTVDALDTKLGQRGGKMTSDASKFDLGRGTQKIITDNKVLRTKEAKTRSKQDHQHTSTQNFDLEGKKMPSHTKSGLPWPGSQAAVVTADRQYIYRQNDSRNNYRFNKQATKATRYWTLFQTRVHQRLGVIQTSRSVQIGQPRVNKADQPVENPSGLPLPMTLTKPRLDRSKSRYYTPFGQRDSSKAPARAGVSVKLDVDAAQALVTQNLGRGSSRFDEESNSASQNREVSHLDIAGKAQSASSVQSMDHLKGLLGDHATIRTNLLGDQLIADSTKHPEELVKTTPTVGPGPSIELQPTTDPNMTTNHPAYQESGSVYALEPTDEPSLNHGSLEPGLKTGITEKTDSPIRISQAVQSANIEVFTTPKDLAEAFSWEDQFLTLKTLTGAEPVVFMGGSGTSKINYSTPTEESPDKTLLQTQIDLKFKRLRDNIDIEHAEELERTRTTVKSLIARKSQPLQRTSKDAAIKMGELNMN